uniref:Uncharacterized protein n=1 Tax=Romanomermis culicivorax TaxID=13658 RepID=A0A915KVP1_ROMCU
MLTHTVEHSTVRRPLTPLSAEHSSSVSVGHVAIKWHWPQLFKILLILPPARRFNTKYSKNGNLDSYGLVAKKNIA